jgi:hypothetical protein
MPKSVHITTPPLSFKVMARDLRIPKARQIELLTILDEASTKTPKQEEKTARSVEARKRRKRAPAA